MLSDPTSRRPERRRALKATIRWSYELLFPDDQRGLWALATFAGGAPLAGGRVRPRSARRAGGGGDRRGRPAREPFARDRRRRRRRRYAVRYRLLDSIRAFALEAMADAGLTERALAAHAAWFADAAAIVHARACAAVARPSTSPSPGPSAPTSTPRWPGAPRTTRCSRSTSSTGSAGPGSSSATAEARNGSWPRSTPPATRPRPATAPAPCCSRRGSKRRRVTSSSPATTSPRPTELADAIGDVDLQARCCYYLAYVVSHDGEFRAGAGADRSQPTRSTTGWTGRGTRPRTGSSPPGPRSPPATRRAASRLAIRSSTGCETVDDPWLHVRRDAMLGELARIQHRFDDAVVHIGRAAETSRRLGFLQTEAYQVSSLGRAQCQAGDYDAGAATLELAIDKAEATGDVRLAALARVHLGRVLRALGRDARGADGTRSGDRVAPRRRRRRAGRARRVPAGRDGRRGSGRRRRGTARRDPRRRPARRRRPRRGLRPRRARPHRRRSAATSPRPATSARRPTGAWRPPPTSSPSSTAPTPMRSGSSSESAVARLRDPRRRRDCRAGSAR